MTVEQVLGIKRHHGIDSLKKPRQVAFLIKRSAEVRHNEITDEQHVIFGRMNEHAIDRFSAWNRNEFKTRPAHDHLGMLANRDIGLKISDEFFLEIGAKKEGIWKFPAAFADDIQLLAVVIPGIEHDRSAQITEIAVSANMVPVGVGHEHCRQWREVRDAIAQKFIGRLR